MPFSLGLELEWRRMLTVLTVIFLVFKLDLTSSKERKYFLSFVMSIELCSECPAWGEDPALLDRGGGGH